MECKSCGFENPADFTFCGKCGTSFTSVCPQCGFESPPGFAFCGKCGASLESGRGYPTKADIDHLRAYLPPALIEALQYDPSSPLPSLLEQCTDHLSRLLETIYTHLPLYLVEQVVQVPIPGQTSGQFIDGTLLFADISGFTAMSEHLSRIGREGAEEITAIVNRYFSAMLSILREHRGQLVKFGGDALLGLFFEPDSATHAVQAAQRMQAMMTTFAQTNTSQGVFALQMKVGIHKGRFFAAQLGTAQSMEYALFGADVNSTAATESAALAGQILVDQATFEALTLPCHVTPASPNAPYLVIEEIESALLPPASLTPPLPHFSEPTLASLRRLVELLDALTPYLPAGLLARIASDAGTGSEQAPYAIGDSTGFVAGLEGEHRLVAVLFANVRGLGEIADRLGPGHEEQIVSALNQYYVAMENNIHHFGGVINKIDLYDHGDKMLVFFGAPLAHEDDSERAVGAGLAMQETLAEINRSLSIHIGLPNLWLDQRIGISFGYVFAGYVGTSWRHEYTMMGDEVNLAARLMTKAEPGSVVVSSDVRRKVQALFDLDPRGEVELKGKSRPVPLFRIAGPRAMPERVRGLKGMSSPLVGRETEWERLSTAMNQLSSGRGQIVSVTGEAGLGKSRLVAEMRQTSEASRSARWVEGHCLSYTESVSYRPFQELVQQLVGIQPDDAEAEAWGKLRVVLEEKISRTEVDITLPYLANFMNLRLEDSLQEKVRHLDAEALQRRTFVAISTLVETQSSAERPLVLALEDIHWMDQASLALLEHLMPLVSRVPLMLLLVYRPERAKGCWRIGERVAREFTHCATEVALSPLPPTDCQQLLTNLVRIEHWPVDVYELLLSRTEGNPLYLEEVIRTLIDDQALVQDGSGDWRISGDLDAIKVPDTLQGVMMARLDRLEEPCRWTAQLASVVGRVFPFDTLAHIVPENGARLNHSLIRLQQHETIRETQRMPELVYSFRHVMMQEVCYSSLLARIRRLYHRKIAQYLETGRSAGRRDAESNIPLIAQHAFAGQDWRRALRYQLLAGQQAQRLFANHEAINHMERAMECTVHLPPAETLAQRQAIHAALGELLTTTGQYERALEHLNEGLSLAIEGDSRDAQAHVCRWLAELHEDRGEYPLAFDWIQQGLNVLEVPKTADAAEAAELRLIAGLIHTRQGDYDDALEQFQSALHIALQLDEVTTLARAYNGLGVICLRGDSARAIEHFQQAFTLYERAGDLRGQATSHNLVANACFNMGQWHKADQHYRRAREIFDQIGDVYNHAMTDNNLGGIACNQGRLDEALTFYQEALQSLERIGGSSYMLGVFCMNLGATFVRRGEVDANADRDRDELGRIARQHLRTSQEHFERVQARDFLPEMHRHFAEAALLAGELAEAEAQVEQALDLARELAMRSEEGICLRVLGEVAAGQARLEEAKGHLDEAGSILGEVGDEYEEARSLLSLARVCVSQGELEEGSATIDRCTPVFQRLDAALDLATARSLREEIESG